MLAFGMNPTLEEIERLVPSCEDGPPEDLAQALAWRAKLRKNRGALEEALADLERLQTISPRRAHEARELRREVLMRLERAEALPLIDERLADTNLAGEDLVGLVFAKLRLLDALKRHDEARACARAFLPRLAPGDDRLLDYWVQASLKGPRAALEELVEVLAAVIEERPAAITYLRQRAQVLFQLGRLPEALVDAKRAIALAPDDSPLRLMYAQWLIKSRDFDAAAIALEETVAVDPSDAVRRTQVANHFERLSRFDDALRHRRELVALYPDNAALRDALAKAEARSAERDGAPPR